MVNCRDKFERALLHRSDCRLETIPNVTDAHRQHRPQRPGTEVGLTSRLNVVARTPHRGNLANVAICNLFMQNYSWGGSSSWNRVSGCAVGLPNLSRGHATTAWGRKNRLFFTSTHRRVRDSSSISLPSPSPHNPTNPTNAS